MGRLVKQKLRCDMSCFGLQNTFSLKTTTVETTAIAVPRLIEHGITLQGIRGQHRIRKYKKRQREQW